jgi:hypothetical protein
MQVEGYYELPATTPKAEAKPSQPPIKKDDANMATNAKHELNKGEVGVFVTVSILVGLWVLAGLAAFIMSLVCFGKSGSTSEHVLGLLLAMFFGPFYWIYYFVSQTYCKSSTY